MSHPTPLPEQNHQAVAPLPYDHAAMSATTSVKIGGSLTRAHRVKYVWYNNPTGFAADASNYWTIEITDGTNVLASWSTQSTAQGALTADTPVQLVMSASHTDIDGAGVFVATFVKTGIPANLPAGRLVVVETPL